MNNRTGYENETNMKSTPTWATSIIHEEDVTGAKSRSSISIGGKSHPPGMTINQHGVMFVMFVI